MSKLTNTQNFNLAEITNQISEIHNNESGFQATKGSSYSGDQNNNELNS